MAQAKAAWGIRSDIFWLDPNTVPTMGDYFRTAGYRSFYKGKWHISQEGILIPGTHNALPSYRPAGEIRFQRLDWPGASWS
jgi:arylsulfatase A-like enzyme